ncbi:hypothetical protein [Pontibacillus sp. HMF3514]|uniref:hypothetical protein n=1 Tax=Pontibacillus sp. HMF3514 TaxID=2692425 RepID=UPI0013202DAD|nr:hypothetical protein [Pontibacillus sp. HMF3514]QHE51245.1 hypothetical protein GS400_04005 [Pontibacillus sp. HMF3514]
MQLVLVLLIMYTIYVLTQRYLPVFQASYIDDFNQTDSDLSVIDLRDYIDSSHSPIQGAIDIPLAYLKRHSTQIPNQKVMVIASDSVEKNIGVRVLKRKGFEVVGFYYPNENINEVPRDIIKI